MNYDNSRIKYYLKNILSIGSPSGYTNKIMNYIMEELNYQGIDYKVSNKGVIIAYIKGKDSKRARTFTAHVDTLGAMVKAVKSNGALSIVPIGGFMMNCVEGETCVVETMEGKSYSGTIQTVKPSVHISGDEARELKRSVENMELILDEKVFSKEDTENLGIGVGDFVCIDTRTIFTEKDFIKSRYLDDKASVAVLLYAMEYISKNSIELAYDTYFYISNYEEVGHGARASLPENTEEFIAVDMGAPGVGQNSSEYSVCICAKDSSGPYDYDLRKKLIDTCKRHNIDYRIDIYPYYGSDASAALGAGHDIRAGLIGPGVFASHGYERTHLDSILATIDLIIKYSQES
jgi:putative aminopeptidase FrvX